MVPEGLYLLDEIKGSRAADELMGILLAWAGERPMTLHVAAYNTRAIRFYERYQFSSTEELDIFRDRIPMQTMRRPPHPVAPLPPR